MDVDATLPMRDGAGFFAYDLRIGTIAAVHPNPGARKPAYVLDLDLGPLGHRTSSAQLTVRYRPEDLIGRQVVCVVNLPPRRIAGVESQVLVLGAILGDGDVVLLEPEGTCPDGARIG